MEEIVEEDLFLEISNQEQEKSLEFEGRLIVADDQLINLVVLKRHIEKIGLLTKTICCVDG